VGGYDIDDAIRSTAAGRRLAQRRPLATDIGEVVMDMLLNHSLAPGARINIDGLARTLGVSPTPVREALAGIESQGLIIKSPQRGYTVAPLIDLGQLHELTELRLLIEPSVAAAAAERATAREATSLRAFARTGGAGSSDPTAIRLDMTYDAEFHDRLALLAGNGVVRDTLSRLRSHLHMYRLFHHAGQAAATKPEHLAIAKAVASADPEAARAAMESHLRAAMNRLDDVFAGGDVTTTRTLGSGGSVPLAR
jgi:DNA-binding GntR family transcriptional regulator